MTISDINLEHLNMILTFLTSFSYSAFTNHCEEVLEPKKSTHVPEEKKQMYLKHKRILMSEASFHQVARNKNQFFWMKYIEGN